ncbi:MAG: SpoIIE family protein phosphatase [Methanospirillaceae archaeon]|nr:SpoIIE family protein phosphatase [Methanospirillaceae archaeon]
MNRDNPEKPLFSLRRYLMIVIIAIIIIVSLTSLSLTYLVGEEAAIHLYTTFTDYSAENAEKAVILVSRSLDLIDDRLDPAMEKILLATKMRYLENNDTITNTELSGIIADNDPGINGTVVLKVIDPEGIIVYSTVPGDIGIDFRKWPEIYRGMEEIRAGDRYVPDRVTVSLNGTSDTDFSGKLSKYGYLPSPDKDYLFAVGIISDYFEERDMALSYQQVLDEFGRLDPDILAIRLYHRYKPDPIAQTGSPKTGLPISERKEYVDRTFATHEEIRIEEEDGDCSRFVFVPIMREGEVFDNSLVMEHVVSKNMLSAMLHEIIIICLQILLVAVLVGAVLTLLVSRRITRSFNRVISDITTIADGDLDHAISGARIAEFARLETSINTMVRKIRYYSTELERKEAELAIAAKIQRTFLPKECPDIAGLEIMMHTLPAREVGGDFYDLISLDDNRYGIVIADVSGKGVPAALFMASSRTLIRGNAAWYPDPAALIFRVNNLIVENTENEMFVTVFYGIADLSAMTLTYCNAGHNPPVLLHEDTVIGSLHGTGMAAGVIADTPYTSETISLTTGDVLVCYTDGITEAIDTDKNQFGEERLIPLIRKDSSLCAKEIVGDIIDAVTVFSGNEPQFDDITLVVARF